jgi:hypothetical protein
MTVHGEARRRFSGSTLRAPARARRPRGTNRGCSLSSFAPATARSLSVSTAQTMNP